MPVLSGVSSAGRLLSEDRRSRATAGLVGIAVAYVVAQVVLPKGLPFLVLLSGGVTGGLVAFTAMGLVLIFRTTRIINFAQANMGGLPATLVVLMVTVMHWNYWLALLFGLGVSLLVGAWVERGLLGPIREAPRLIVTVATIGIAQLLGALTLYVSGTQLDLFGFHVPRLFDVPTNQATVTPFHVPWHVQAHAGTLLVTADYFVALIAIPLMLVALSYYFNRTDNGLGARAAADSAERALLLGMPVRRLSLVTWMVASAMSGLGAVLLAGVQGFQSNILSGPETLVAPLAAAVVAGFDSLAIAFVASLFIGVLEKAVFWSYPQSSNVDLVLFVFIVLVLLVRRRAESRVGGDDLGGFVALSEPRPLSESVAALPLFRAAKTAGFALVMFVATVVPLWLTRPQITFFSFVAIFMIVGASLVVLAGWGGQISLCQFSFVGLGAGMAGYLLTSHHSSMLVCLAGATGVGLLSALLIGLAALRVSGLYLAVLTMAFAVPASTFLLSHARFPSFTPISVDPPFLFGRYDLSSPRSFYYFCLVFALIALGVARNFRRTRIGRATIATRDNERFAAAASISAIRVRLIAFGVSGALAGLAGGLYVVAYRGIPYNGFDPVLNFQVFTMVVVGGMASLWGAVAGALYVYLAQFFLGAAGALLVTGGGIVAVLTLAPGGLADLGYRLRDRVVRRLLRRQGTEIEHLFSGDDSAGRAARLSLRSRSLALLRHSRAITSDPSPGLGTPAGLAEGQGATQPDRALLRVRDLEAGYGHLQILFGVNAEVADGEVFALLGTNGAGKSTILRVISGLLPAGGGSVVFDGEDITRLKPAERVARGVVLVPGGRGVFGSLTVAENLRLAAWLARRRGEHQFITETLDEVHELFPVLKVRSGQKAALLSGGEQQMLTIAQALLCRPRLFMIDELSLGLAPVVVGQLLEVLRRLNRQGITIVLVEQSMNIAADVAPRAVFLEKGQVRFAGLTKELVSQTSLVRSVFLNGRASRPGAPAELANDWGAQLGTREPPQTDGSLTDQDRGPEIVLETRGLRKSYGGVTAVDGVDLALPKGVLLGVIGANGAGKTTLFDIICGFVKQDEGQVSLNRLDVSRMPSAGRFALGLGRTFQDLRLVPSMTVAELLAVTLERHIDVREPVAALLGLPAAWRSEAQVDRRVEELMAGFHLDRFANSFISELSTGTRRIVELACVTAHDPQVLVLDEPSSGLAQKEAEAMIPVLLDLKERTGMTIAIIEHDIPMIKELADQVVCLHLGQVIAHGPTADVLADPAVIASYLGVDEIAVQRSGSAQLRGSSKAQLVQAGKTTREVL